MDLDFCNSITVGPYCVPNEEYTISGINSGTISGSVRHRIFEMVVLKTAYDIA